MNNKKYLNSLIWVENCIDNSFRELLEYKRELLEVIIDVYEDIFVGKYFRSYGEMEIRKIKGIKLRSMGLRFVIDDTNGVIYERYFFNSDSIFDDEY